jgi:cell division protease FtsH
MSDERPQRPSSHHGDDHRHPSGWRVSPESGGRGTPPRPPASTGVLIRRWLTFLLVIVAFDILILSIVGPAEPTTVRVPYTPVFLEQLRAGNIESIDSEGATVQGRFRRAVAYPKDAEPREHFRTEIPTYADGAALERLLQSENVVVNAKPVETGRTTFGAVLLTLLPTLLIVGLIVMLLRRSGGMGAMGFGRSRARRIEPSQQRIAFKDVAGIDEAKQELTQIVDFLRDPDKYRRLGGRIPRGVLLTGPPGTGKTLLARAMAGEADVPFFSIAASEFVELYVGVGASRVRDLFAQAKEAAPAIVFIDELDAIGRARGPGSMSGGHEEREQTLNQILTEMDGFDPSLGVIVLSATNRPEVLDRALLRPGRFDRRVTLEPPDTPGRRAILDVHTRSVPLGADVDLDRLAARTPGMVGADLANLVNEAALIAASRDEDAVAAKDLDDALDRLVLGSERRVLMTEAERRRTAYHEAGHAIVGMLTPGADPVRKVSIIPHGKTLGVTLSAPEADRFSYDEAYLRAKIDVALGGQVAEALVEEGISTGAENDLRQATELARHMAGTWGMSEAIGPMTVLTDPDQAIAYPATSKTSEATQRLLDDEVRRMLGESRTRVTALVTEHRTALDALAAALQERETLDEDAARAVVTQAEAASSSMPTA